MPYLLQIYWFYDMIVLYAYIFLLKVDSEQLYRRVILSNDGTDFGVARPKSMVLDPEGGLVFFIYSFA